MYVAPFLIPEKLNLDRREVIGRYFEAIKTGDYAALELMLTTDAVTRWPQSNERITGAASCVRVYEGYPGGPPTFEVERVSGDGDVWVAELTAAYGDERWYTVSVIEFRGFRIARVTDYFGKTFPAPEWRMELVDRADA